MTDPDDGSVGAEPATEPPPSVRPRSARWPYLRAVLFGLVIVTLPFNWTETTSCQSSPARLNTGLALFNDFGTASVALTLTAMTFVTLWLASRVTSFMRATAHLLSTVGCAALLAFVQFVATFSVGDKLRVLPACYIAISALALSLVEGVTRTILATLEAWWGWQDRRRLGESERNVE